MKSTELVSLWEALSSFLFQNDQPGQCKTQTITLKFLIPKGNKGKKLLGYQNRPARATYFYVNTFPLLFTHGLTSPVFLLE